MLLDNACLYSSNSHISLKMQDNPVRAIHNFIFSNGTILPPYTGSRAASVPKDDARVTEIVDGLIVTRPAKKYADPKQQEQKESEPEITILNDSWDKQNSKAASVSSINKMKAIHDFITSNGRI
jgi:hypothetical protein